MDVLIFLTAPFIASLVIVGIHVYLGIHVVKRGVIFVDLALAQIAALGAIIGFLFGFDLHNSWSTLWSLGFTFIGAFIFSMTRTRDHNIPEEAFIGITYAVCAAFSILAMSKAPEGAEHIKDMLVGNILTVSYEEIIKISVIYFVVGILHFIFRKKIFLISTNIEKAKQDGINIRLWDFLFYMSFGIVVTQSVQIAGVLLVFAFLITPTITSMLFKQSVKGILFLGWTIGTLVTILGITLSYVLDLPTGATIVCTFGGVLIIAMLISGIKTSILGDS